MPQRFPRTGGDRPYEYPDTIEVVAVPPHRRG